MLGGYFVILRILDSSHDHTIKFLQIPILELPDYTFQFLLLAFILLLLAFF